MKKGWAKWLIVVLAIVLILGAAAGMLLAWTDVDFVDTYGGILEDGKFVYITIQPDGTMVTNWLDRPAAAACSIEYPYAQRINTLQAGKYFAEITFSDFSSGYYGYATGLFRTNAEGVIELVLQDGTLTKGVHTEEEYYYLQGKKNEELDALRALSFYQKANGVNDAGDRIRRLSEKILGDYQDTESTRYTSGQAFTDLLAICAYADPKVIGPLMDIAYDNWLNDIPRALDCLQESTDAFFDAPDNMLKLTQRLMAEYRDPASYCRTSHQVFLDLLSVYDRLSAECADTLMSTAYTCWLDHCSEPISTAIAHAQDTSPVFGRYEQDGDTGNGPEAIRWSYIPYLNDASTIMLMASNALEYLPYHTGAAGVAWEDSSLYQWLNEDFVNAAFSPAEAGMIEEVTILSREEIEAIFKNYQATRQGETNYGYPVVDANVSDYVYQKSGSSRTKYTYVMGMSEFWLREAVLKASDTYGNIAFETAEPGSAHDIVPVLILKTAWE